MPMQTGEQYCASQGLDVTKERITQQEFWDAKVPMVVACKHCEMTMSVLSSSVRINEDLDVFCRTCAGEMEGCDA